MQVMEDHEAWWHNLELLPRNSHRKVGNKMGESSNITLAIATMALNFFEMIEKKLLICILDRSLSEKLTQVEV